MPDKSRAEYMRTYRRKRKENGGMPIGYRRLDHIACDKRIAELLTQVETLKSENARLRAALPF